MTAPSSYTSLRLERRGAVALLTLDRPDKLNALNADLRDETLAALAEVREDDDVRVLVLTGAGRGFCSGADLTGGGPALEHSQDDRLDELGWVGRQALGVYGLDKPTIAAVNGVAAGAGMSLALACDLRVGGPATRFRTVFLERNLSPDSGMSWFLPRIVGYSRAMDLICTSRDVAGDEAYRLGLLDRFVGEGDDVVAAAMEVADKMALLPPLALRSAKRVVQRNLDADLETALRYEMVGLGFSRKAKNDAQESLASFREKRPARFTGS